MKKIFTLGSALTLTLSLLAQEVRLTYETHAFDNNRVNDMLLADYVEPGQAGKNQVWDLSGMTKAADFKGTKDFRGTIGDAPESDLQNHFPESNTVLNEFENKFYFRMDRNSLEGYGMTSCNGAMVYRYDKPYVKMKYPFTYGDRFSGDYHGTVTNNSGQYPLEGTYEVVADGTGKLILPGGITHPHTLRVKTTRSYRIHFNNDYRMEVVTYRWYNSQETFPLAVLITSSYLSGEKPHVSHTAAYKNAVYSYDEPLADAEESIHVYPNPAEHQFTVEYTVKEEADVQIALFDNAGKKVATLVSDRRETGNYSLRVNAEEYALDYGTYFLRSTIGGQSSTNSIVIL